MTNYRMRAAALVACALAAAPSTAPIAAAEERSFAAFAPLMARGKQGITDEDGVTRMFGGLSGPLYAETSDGPRERGLLVCEFVLVIDSNTLAENGRADCDLTLPGEADAIEAIFECVGAMGEGCEGTFEITGGTGAYETASGGGDAVLRARQRTFGLGADNEVIETVYAMAHFPKLTLNLPD